MNKDSYCLRELQDLTGIYSFSETRCHLLVMSYRAFYITKAYITWLTREAMYHIKFPTNSRSIIYSLTIPPVGTIVSSFTYHWQFIYLVTIYKNTAYKKLLVAPFFFQSSPCYSHLSSSLTYSTSLCHTQC